MKKLLKAFSIETLSAGVLAAHGEIFSKPYQIKSKSDFIYRSTIDLEPNERPFGYKSIG